MRSNTNTSWLIQLMEPMHDPW